MDKETRSRMMAGIRGKNTKPEMMIRQGLHRLGFRFRLHSSKVPGKPDLILSRYGAVVFVHGCFWHGHDCHLFKMPSTRREFWETKIGRNIERDHEVRLALRKLGWRQLIIWECSLKGKQRLPLEIVIQRTAEWIKSGNPEHEIIGLPSS